VTGTPLVALAGVTWWLASGRFHWETLVLAASMAMATGLSITAGYHRLLSHRSYKASLPMRFLFMLFGAASFEESAVSWCRDHRKHHRYLDQDGDPYSITRGFWHAHFLWMFHQSPDGENWPADLWRDPLIRWQHRLYVPTAILIGLVMPAAIGFAWGDPWGGFFLAGVTRIVMNHHFTFAINSVCHRVGKQTYSERYSARDSWVMALFTYGEGYHNFHHVFPSDYRNGYERHHWDPTKWLIAGLSRLRLATDLRVTAHAVVEAKRRKLRDRRLQERLATLVSTDLNPV
jgi:stearoyl-CoA desaturase (delta-9 desaturase)